MHVKEYVIIGDVTIGKPL